MGMGVYMGHGHGQGVYMGVAWASAWDMNTAIACGHMGVGTRAWAHGRGHMDVHVHVHVGTWACIVHTCTADKHLRLVAGGSLADPGSHYLHFCVYTLCL